MKALLILAALLVSTNAMAVDWTRSTKSDYGTMFIDFDSLEIVAPGVIQFWRKVELTKPENVSNDPNGMELGNKMTILTYIDCNARAITTTHINTFLNKKYINQGPGMGGKWQAIDPAGSAEPMREQLCQQVVFDLIQATKRMEQVH